MIISKTPFRISLFGGSTDHPFFIKLYKKSLIINFSCNLKTHVTLYQDKFGYNTNQQKYILNYYIIDRYKNDVAPFISRYS